MLLLLNAHIPCLTAYILPTSPVLLHVYFSTSWHCHPYILQHFNGNAFTPLCIHEEEEEEENDDDDDDDDDEEICVLGISMYHCSGGFYLL